MEISADHWLGAVRHCPSPNCNERPDPAEISLIVVHGISLPPEDFGGPWIDDLFCNRLDPSQHPYFETIAALTVSAHLLIRRDGEVVQYVPFNQRAWHAGQSCWQGRENCNDFSIGIELEGTDTLAYTDIQYEKLAELIHVLNQRYPASRQNVVGHSDIAPGRKTDPGESFDWPRLHSLLQHRESLA